MPPFLSRREFPRETARRLPALTVSCLLGLMSCAPNEHTQKQEQPAAGILDHRAGTILCRVKFAADFHGRDHSIFHTNDSRYVLYVDTYHSAGLGREILRIAARAGGNRRASEPGGGSNFPEASIIIDNDGSLKDYRHASYSPFPFAPDQWHVVAMSWQGYPAGEVKIYLDGKLAGTKAYDSRYDDNRPMFTSYAIGYRPENWVGEITTTANGEVMELKPRTNMAIEGSGIAIKDLKIFRRALDQSELEKFVAPL